MMNVIIHNKSYHSFLADASFEFEKNSVSINKSVSKTQLVFQQHGSYLFCIFHTIVKNILESVEMCQGMWISRCYYILAIFTLFKFIVYS